MCLRPSCYRVVVAGRAPSPDATGGFGGLLPFVTGCGRGGTGRRNRFRAKRRDSLPVGPRKTLRLFSSHPSPFLRSGPVTVKKPKGGRLPVAKTKTLPRVSLPLRPPGGGGGAGYGGGGPTRGGGGRILSPAGGGGNGSKGFSTAALFRSLQGCGGGPPLGDLGKKQGSRCPNGAVRMTHVLHRTGFLGVVWGPRETRGAGSFLGTVFWGPGVRPSGRARPARGGGKGGYSVGRGGAGVGYGGPPGGRDGGAFGKTGRAHHARRARKGYPGQVIRQGRSGGGPETNGGPRFLFF